jgi:flagellum-specific peptidoglycan hydrolase FlgJ
MDDKNLNNDEGVLDSTAEDVELENVKQKPNNNTFNKLNNFNPQNNKVNLKNNEKSPKNINDFKKVAPNQLGKNVLDKKNADVQRLNQALNKRNQMANQAKENQEANTLGQKVDKVGEEAVRKLGGKAITAATGGAVSGPVADAIANAVAKPVGKTLKYGLLISMLPLFFIVFFCFSIFAAFENLSTDSNASTTTDDSTKVNFCRGTTIVATDLRGLNQDQVVELLGPLAQSAYMETGILASTTLGQMLEESGCGQMRDGEYKCSSLAERSNNLFGMNAGYKFSRGGWDGVSKVGIYKKYASVNDSVIDYAVLLADGKNYKGITTKTDYKDQIELVQKGGYCCEGDLNYISRVTNLIESHNLTKWDTKSSSVNSSVCTQNDAKDWSIRTVAPTKSDTAFDYLKKNNVGQCVWYAQGRAVEIIQELMKNGKMDSTTGNEAIKRLGSIRANAEGWYRKSKGLFKGSENYKEVKSGSIISWSGGSTMCNPRCGHVAVVESATDSEVIVTDGWANGGSSCPGTWSCIRFRSQTMTRKQFEDWVQTEGVQGAATGKKFSGYIYFLELEG